MKILSFIFVSVFLASCAAQSPAITKGKGVVYGTLKAQSHSQFLEKVSKENSDHFYEDLDLDDTMINYPKLKGLYAGIINPSYNGGKTYKVVAQKNGIFPRSIALSPGDKLSIRNSTGAVLSFFLADSNETFQDLSKISAGETKSFIVQVQGNLELNTDENENLKVFILSEKGLMAQKLTSGESYAFENLEPGNYKMVFWFWRLGKVVRQIQIESGQKTMLNELLSVNSVIH